MVEFVNRRLLTLTRALYPKDIAVAVAARLRRHVQAHDRTTEALGIRAGRDHRPAGETDRSKGEGKDRHHHEKVGHSKRDADDAEGGADDDDELQEDDVEVRIDTRRPLCPWHYMGEHRHVTITPHEAL